MSDYFSWFSYGHDRFWGKGESASKVCRQGLPAGVSGCRVWVVAFVRSRVGDLRRGWDGGGWWMKIERERERGCQAAGRAFAAYSRWSGTNTHMTVTRITLCKVMEWEVWWQIEWEWRGVEGKGGKFGSCFFLTRFSFSFSESQLLLI